MVFARVANTASLNAYMCSISIKRPELLSSSDLCSPGITGGDTVCKTHSIPRLGVHS